MTGCVSVSLCKRLQIVGLNAMVVDASAAQEVLPSIGGVACLNLLLDMLHVGFRCVLLS